MTSLNLFHILYIFNLTNPTPPLVSFFFKSTLRYPIHCKKLTRKTVKGFQVCIYNLSSTKSRTAQVDVGMSDICISVHLCGSPCPENTGKTTAKEKQNIPRFIPQSEWFLVSFTAARVGAGPVGKFCKAHLHSDFVYLQINTMLLAVCSVSLLGSVYSRPTNRKCLSHVVQAVHVQRVQQKVCLACATTLMSVCSIASSP